jgi:hypothetical protein
MVYSKSIFKLFLKVVAFQVMISMFFFAISLFSYAFIKLALFNSNLTLIKEMTQSFWSCHGLDSIV